MTSRALWRWEMRTLVVIPTLVFFVGLAIAYFAIELTLDALGPVPLSPAQSFALQKVRLGLIGLGSVGSLGLGLMLAMTIAQPLQRMVRRTRARLAAVNPAPLGPAPINEIAALFTTMNHVLRAVDKFMADSQILEGIPEGVLLADGQGRVKQANAAARRLLYSSGAVVEGQELTRVFGPEVGPVLAQALGEVREQGAAVELPSVVLIEPDGARAELSVTLAPFSGNGSGGVLVTLKDLSELPTLHYEIQRVDQPDSMFARRAKSTVSRLAAPVSLPMPPPEDHNGRKPVEAFPLPAQPSAPEARNGGGLAAPVSLPVQPVEAFPLPAQPSAPEARNGGGLAAPVGFPAQASAPKTGAKTTDIPALVDSLIEQALGRRASDIHLEPHGQGMQVRFRIDGLLQDVASISPEERAAVVARIKIMANLDIAEHRLPQDGRIRIRQNCNRVDARISTIPSLYGEKVVLRLLDLEAVAIPLNRIGLSEATLSQLRSLIRRPQGLLFVTGPTGSGKTSSIYACLNDIKSETTNIVTIEDPIEYEMAGVTQIAVHDKIGLSFATCLRSVLRQDPDVILVGEVRDLETARITMQASLTGHMVFATLHTNDAAGAITRLLDMDIPPYLIASSLTGVLAQRLVRVLCPACKTPWEPDAGTRAALGLGEVPVTFSRAAGCEQCHGSGAVGRTGIFELLLITPELRTLITARASEEELRREARAAGMTFLFQDGLQRVLDGVVAYEELVRVAEPDRPLPVPDDPRPHGAKRKKAPVVEASVACEELLVRVAEPDRPLPVPEGPRPSGARRKRAPARGAKAARPAALVSDTVVEASVPCEELVRVAEPDRPLVSQSDSDPSSVISKGRPTRRRKPSESGHPQAIS